MAANKYQSMEMKKLEMLHFWRHVDKKSEFIL